MSDIKAWLQKLKEGKGNLWLTCLLLGLLLLVITIPAGDETPPEAVADGTSAEGAENVNEITNVQKDAASLERRLESMLRQVEGVGEVEVMITLCSSGEKIVEKDVRSTDGESEQSQADQSGSASSGEREESTIYERLAGGAEVPYVKEVREPRVEGVVVAAEGGGNSVTAAEITNAVMALFGIDAHKIVVMKKK